MIEFNVIESSFNDFSSNKTKTETENLSLNYHAHIQIDRSIKYTYV